MPPSNSPPVSGLEIETHRRVAGLSQASLAEMLGVSAPTVNRWEKGDQDIPGPADKLLRMIIRGEMPLDLPTAGLGAQVREDIGAVEMTVDAFEECLRQSRAAGFGSVTEWIAHLVRVDLEKEKAAMAAGAAPGSTLFMPERQPVVYEKPKRGEK